MNQDCFKIIVADDDHIICNFFESTLQRLGHEVVAISHDGQSLVAACEEHIPDLVITDLEMPGNDGIWSAEFLDDTSQIPVIIISAHHEPDLVRLSSARNIQAYLVKPIKAEDLKMAIALVMQKRSQETADTESQPSAVHTSH